jgi:hypothetical protein
MIIDAETRALLPGLSAALETQRAARSRAARNHESLAARLAAEARANGTHTRAHERLEVFFAHARGVLEDSGAMIGELELLVSVLAPRARTTRHAVCKGPRA